MARFLINAVNSLISLVVALGLMLSGTYAGYALWDNNRIYAAAEDVQADMLKMKPKVEEGQQGPTFAELLAVNPDVCGWVTLDNTGIDYPVLQGETNLTYINTDVYGNFALAGSIYLDSRNDPTFADPYSLLYGHHMDNSRMFGDLDLYKDKQFFDENTTGTLLLPEGAYKLEIFACLLVPASDDFIFEPTRWQTDISGLLDHVRSSALHYREDTLAALADNPKVLALSTCATEFTDARTIVLAEMNPY
ncbi:MAG: class B sortase [Eubacteriales bacterium]|nr:class B sortase [Eubacteriales bacterium]